MSMLGLGSERATAVGRLVVLHEDQVPELHEPVAVRVVERAAVGAERRAAVDVDLGARAARAGVAHLPEVVLVAEALDAIHRHADLLVPHGLGFVVALVDGDPQAVAVEAEPLGDELPAPRDGVGLEVVAEAEVAEHLEEHEVALGAADIVEVVVLAAGAGALLAGDGAGERRRLVADEVRLERHHAGHREQHRGVVRDEACRRHHRVALRREEVGEGGAELVGGLRWRAHGSLSLPTRHRCYRLVCGAVLLASGAVPLDLHEWISFEDDTHRRTWVFDATFLRRRGAASTATAARACSTPTPRHLAQGCCSYGAHFIDDADVQTVVLSSSRG